MYVENLKECKELIQTYENITLEQLQEKWIEMQSEIAMGLKGWLVLNQLTGFGKGDTCPLCKAVNDVCSRCIHSIRPYDDTPCIEETYDDIYYSEDVETLYNAIQNRIKYLKFLCNEADEHRSIRETDSNV